MLRNEGFESAVVDLGEYRTIGRHPDGRPWRIGIRDGRDFGSIDRMVDLEDMALAVSGGYGTTFEASGRFHHIFDPRTGASANSLVDVAVIGPQGDGSGRARNRHLRRRRGSRADAARGLSTDAGDPDPVGRDVAHHARERSMSVPIANRRLLIALLVVVPAALLAQTRPQPGTKLSLEPDRSTDVSCQRGQEAQAHVVAERCPRRGRAQFRRRQCDGQIWRPATLISENISRGEYGAVDGLPRILRLLDKYQIPASFFIPAVSHLLHPQMIPAHHGERASRDRGPRLDSRAPAVRQ